MNRSLNVLIIDDNPDDRALVARELRRVFEALDVSDIANADSFSKALAGDKPDLVITDFQLRWTDGLVVLRTLKEQWPDCPVIMFTGTGSEEIAVEAMKLGLDDYVLKSPRHYARLPAAVQLVLDRARERRTAREAETRYSRLFDTVPVGLFLCTPEGVLIDANPAFVNMLGFPDRSLLLGKSMAELHVRKSDHQSWCSLMERAGVVHGFESQLRCCAGHICWADMTGRAVREPSGGRIVYEGSIEDITDRKRAEEEREKLIFELQDALGKVKTLSGLLPICAACKKIRDDRGYWNQIEVYIQSHSDAEFTHSFCPECVRRLYPEVFSDVIKSQ